MKFKREYENDIVILSPPKNMFGGAETDELEHEFMSQLAAGRKKFVVDFHRTENMNTKAITMFWKAHAKLREGGATWAFCNVDGKIEHPLVVMKLIRLFNVCVTRAEALQSLQREPAERHSTHASDASAGAPPGPNGAPVPGAPGDPPSPSPSQGPLARQHPEEGTKGPGTSGKGANGSGRNGGGTHATPEAPRLEQDPRPHLDAPGPTGSPDWDAKWPETD